MLHLFPTVCFSDLSGPYGRVYLIVVDAPQSAGARGGHMIPRRLGAALLGACAGATFAVAQAAAFVSLDESAPLKVEASQGIEWRREEGVFIARGDAFAAQGGTEVRADTITARYREAPSGGNRIYRLEATGSVRVASGDNRLFGPTVVYDLEGSLFTVTGGASRIRAIGGRGRAGPRRWPGGWGGQRPRRRLRSSGRDRGPRGHHHRAVPRGAVGRQPHLPPGGDRQRACGERRQPSVRPDRRLRPRRVAVHGHGR